MCPFKDEMTDKKNKKKKRKMKWLNLDKLENNDAIILFNSNEKC